MARLRARQTAFTLIEILVTVSLLTFIILGLYAMFTQVQRAFRMSMSQVDLLEAGRAVTSLLPRELEQMGPSGKPYPNGVNFYAYIPFAAPLTNSLPGTTLLRTNILQDCFMLIRDNQTWTGVGYCVRTRNADGTLSLPVASTGNMGAGSLYRYTTNLSVINPTSGLPNDPTLLFRTFLGASGNNSATSVLISNRVCDGVVHFRFRAYDTNGFLITRPMPPPPRFPRTTDVAYSLAAPGEIGLYQFCSNAVPAAVEMEFGILDQHAWDRYNSIVDPAARLAYLQRSDIASRIQLFRQRVAVRNFDPTAYQ